VNAPTRSRRTAPPGRRATPPGEQARHQRWDRMLQAALSRLLPRPSWSVFFVTPATRLRWHPNLIARARTYPRKRPGRPFTRADVRAVVLRLARENPTRGYQRITIPGLPRSRAPASSPLPDAMPSTRGTDHLPRPWLAVHRQQPDDASRIAYATSSTGPAWIPHPGAVRPGLSGTGPRSGRRRSACRADSAAPADGPRHR
jgi:hypothetical protein